MNNAYETALEAQRKHSKRAWLEPVVLLAVILAYCALIANREADEQQARMGDAAKYRQSICLLQQNNAIHQFKCQVMNETYARLD